MYWPRLLLGKCFESNYVDLNCFAHTRNRLVNIQRKWNYNFDETIHRLVDWDFILRITEGIVQIFKLIPS